MSSRLKPPFRPVKYRETGEKTKWVVRCRRNGLEISVNYRVEPYSGLGRGARYLSLGTALDSRFSFWILITPTVLSHPRARVPRPLFPRHPMNCAADNATHYADCLISSSSTARKINRPAIEIKNKESRRVLTTPFGWRPTRTINNTLCYRINEPRAFWSWYSSNLCGLNRISDSRLRQMSEERLKSRILNTLFFFFCTITYKDCWKLTISLIFVRTFKMLRELKQ